MRKITCITLAMVLLVYVMAVSANIACAAEEIKVGDIIPFGAHDWRVLEIQDGKALLLSDRVIGRRAYSGSNAEVTWETCSLRRYLNGEFYDSFSAEEKARIAETRLTNDDNPWYGTSGGNETSDRIFLLSLEEVVKYFGDSGDLKSRKGWYWENGPVLKDGQGYFINDQYNSARIARAANDEASGWWLRSPGVDSFDAVTVFYSGYVYVSGHYDGIHRSNGGVRPALWLNL